MLTIKPRADVKWVPRGTSTEKGKNKHNLTTLLQCSNVTPFKDKSLLGYICAYCEATHPDPQRLRTHTETDHAQERLNFEIKLEMSKFCVKLDISDLKCTLCEKRINDLNSLKSHLVEVHNKVIHYDIKDRFMQFKLKAGDVFNCALCSAQYETFQTLKHHMNKHYNNYHCPKCDAPFINTRLLTAHKNNAHDRGSFKCGMCDKIFGTMLKRKHHERYTHNTSPKKYYKCPHCGESFRHPSQMNKHLVVVHDQEPKYKCNVCSKAFHLKTALNYHTKKDHLMERNFQCPECDYKCFNKHLLKLHMVAHDKDAKKFTCSVCYKSYARKKTLKEHLKIHNNEKLFQCEICAMAFVQKCSLKSHLLSNHGISMASSEITSVNSSTQKIIGS